MIRLFTTCLALGAALLVYGPAPEAQGFPPGSRARSAARKAKRSQDAQLVKQLRQAKSLLQKANHDYKGHRVKAIAQINKAIAQLRLDASPRRSTKARTTTAKRTTTVKPPRTGGGEPQAVSDAQLKQAQQILTTVQTQLAALPATPYRTLAGTHIGNASTELTTALAVAPK
jgi:hypothetical protein